MNEFLKYFWDNGNVSLFTALCVLSVIFLCIHKKNKHSLFDYVGWYYVIGLIGSIVFYNVIKTNYMEIPAKDVNLSPLLYYITCSLILMTPFLLIRGKFDVIGDWGFRRYFIYIAYLLFFLSIVPFCESLIKIPSLSSESLLASYEGQGGGASFITHYCTQAKNYIQFFAIPLFFYFYSRGGREKKYAYYCLFAFAVSIIQSLIGGARGMMINQFNYAVVGYFLFHNTLNDAAKRTIKKTSIIIFVIMLIGLVAITLARFSGPTLLKNSMPTTISLYVGQGPVEFSRGMWESTVRTEGDNSFSLVKIFTGHHSFKDNNERRLYWEKKQYIPNFIFYTLVGDIYSDLGRVNTVIFSCCCALFMFLLYKKLALERTISVQSSLFVILYYEWITMGMMSNCYKTYYLQFFIFVTVAIIVFMWLCKKLVKG